MLVEISKGFKVGNNWFGVKLIGSNDLRVAIAFGDSFIEISANLLTIYHHEGMQEPSPYATLTAWAVEDETKQINFRLDLSQDEFETIMGELPFLYVSYAEGIENVYETSKNQAIRELLDDRKTNDLVMSFVSGESFFVVGRKFDYSHYMKWRDWVHSEDPDALCTEDDFVMHCIKKAIKKTVFDQE